MTVRSAIAARFRGMPIRRKLRVILVVTTAMALLLAGIGIVVADTLLFQRSLERDLETFVRVIGDNSVGALAFDDAKAGGETLAALRARPHVQTACLYETNGDLLASYSRPGYTGVCPRPNGNRVQSGNGVLVASHEAYLSGKHEGTLVLQYDLEEIPDRVQIYGLTVLLALLLSSIAAIVLSTRLRALIAEPILELANATKTVSQTKDYSIRARKLSDDEVGVMADALNQMLDGIQSRDEDLRKAIDMQRTTMTRLSHVNADLKRTNTELARSNQDLERFTFVASHDLQEPLRMITTYSQLLVAEKPAQPNGHNAQYVEYIVNGTRRMRELLSDLLSYTEISGASEQPAEVVDLNSVIRKVKEALSARIAETQADVLVDPLPSLKAHESRMISLFLNLIGNAIKYRGDQRPRIHVTVFREPGEFIFAVADNGIGIPAEYHEAVFEAFKRLHGREIAGTGIGLAICQRIVERYGGQIWVESEPGSGATFRFTLPGSLAA